MIHCSAKIGKRHRMALQLWRKLAELKEMVKTISQQECLGEKTKQLILLIMADFYKPEEV